MRIKHRFIIREDESKEIINFFKNRNLKCKVSKITSLITVEIYEDDIWWYELKSLMDKYDILSLCECVYTREEFERATWIAIRSKWRWEYPQPANNFDYKHITYNDSKCCRKCGAGLVQKECFRVRKPPQWGKKNFLMLNWVEDEVFINNNVELILKSADLKGLQFYDVKNAKNNETIQNMKQIFISKVLEPGLVKQNETVLHEIKCNNCSGKKYILTGKGIVFDRKVMDNISCDIVKSSEAFGDGNMYAKIILVSKRFYETIKENNLGNDLVFEPVLLK